MLLSSERLGSLREAESPVSFVGSDEGGVMLMLGLSMMMFVCSVPAGTPFLSVDEPLLTDSRLCEFD